MRKPYRIGVWGPGVIGSTCIEGVLRDPALELVGVLAYDAEKDGIDAGTLVGLEPCSLRVTTDREAFLATAPECVFYTARDFGDFRADEDILALLRAGINVVSSLPYQNITIRGPEVVAKFEDACRAGNATLHGAGINPGFMFERLLMTATGGVSEIRHILQRETTMIGAEPEAQLRDVCGFGLPEAEARSKAGASSMWTGYHAQFLYLVAEMQGITVDRLAYEITFEVAPETFRAPTMTIEKGTVAHMNNRWTVHSGDRTPLVSETVWYMGDSVRPAGTVSDDFYLMEIEGTPSMRIGVELKSSLETGSRYPSHNHHGPTYYTTAAPMLQAVPAVVDGPAGIRRIAPPSNGYWKTDMRNP
jgi:2,4-diaminopentanoate dehydrogenase